MANFFELLNQGIAAKATTDIHQQTPPCKLVPSAADEVIQRNAKTTKCEPDRYDNDGNWLTAQALAINIFGNDIDQNQCHPRTGWKIGTWAAEAEAAVESDKLRIHENGDDMGKKTEGGAGHILTGANGRLLAVQDRDGAKLQLRASRFF